MKNRVCEICQSVDASWWCLHHYLCIECAGGANIKCVKCNPNHKLFMYDNKKTKKIVFLD